MGDMFHEHLAAAAREQRDRRERIAMAAMQGLLCQSDQRRDNRWSPQQLASDALDYADALIAALDAAPTEPDE